MVADCTDIEIDIQLRMSKLFKPPSLETLAYETLHDELSKLFDEAMNVPPRTEGMPFDTPLLCSLSKTTESFLASNELQADVVPDTYWHALGDLVLDIPAEVWEYTLTPGLTFLAYYAKMCPPEYLGRFLDDSLVLYGHFDMMLNGLPPSEERGISATHRRQLFGCYRSVIDSFGAAMVNEAIGGYCPRNPSHARTDPHQHDELTAQLATVLAELDHHMLKNTFAMYPASDELLDAMEHIGPFRSLRRECLALVEQPHEKREEFEHGKYNLFRQEPKAYLGALLVSAPYARRILEERHDEIHFGSVSRALSNSTRIDRDDLKLITIRGLYGLLSRHLVALVIRYGADGATNLFETYLAYDLPFEDVLG